MSIFFLSRLCIFLKIWNINKPRLFSSDFQVKSVAIFNMLKVQTSHWLFQPEGTKYLAADLAWSLAHSQLCKKDKHINCLL